MSRTSPPRRSGTFWPGPPGAGGRLECADPDAGSVGAGLPAGTGAQDPGRKCPARVPAGLGTIMLLRKPHGGRDEEESDYGPPDAAQVSRASRTIIAARPAVCPDGS